MNRHSIFGMKDGWVTPCGFLRLFLAPGGLIAALVVTAHILPAPLMLCWRWT